MTSSTSYYEITILLSAGVRIPIQAYERCNGEVTEVKILRGSLIVEFYQHVVEHRICVSTYLHIIYIYYIIFIYDTFIGSHRSHVL